jgi:5-methylcytosine-specific restriction protein B
MKDGPLPIQQAIKEFDREGDRQATEVAEQERRAAVERFPLDAWPTMPLERFALGQGNKQDSFCWCMEYGTPHVGSMKGGNARKHAIYKQHDGNWFFDRKSYQSIEEAWQAVRAGFVQAFQKVKAGDFDGIDQIEGINWGPALRTKALHCYFPDQFLPITSIAHIRHYLQVLHSPLATAGGYEVVRLNRALLEALRQTPGMEGWNTYEMSHFLYRWDDPRDQRRIVKIAPGENARFWPECLDGGYIRVGWGKVGDLRQFESKEAFQVKFKEEYGPMYKDHQPTITKKGNEVWTLRELEPGDLVLANQGTSKVLAVGEVVEPGYEWSDGEADYDNIVHVKWDTSYAQDISPQKSWAMTTVAPVPQTLLAQVMAKKAGPKPIIPMDPFHRQIMGAIERKGQAVLYGPPGTGKTYAARRFAVWWLAKQAGEDPSQILADPASFDQAEQRLSTAQVGRKVWWVVANPSVWDWDQLFKDKHVNYRYGRLQRNYPLVRKGDLVVGYQSNPDKKLVALAKVSRELYTDTKGEQNIDLEPVAKIEDGLTYEELQKDETLVTSEPMRFRNQGTLFSLTEDEFDHLAALLTERNPSLRKYLDVAGSGVGPLTRLTFHPSYSYEDFIEGFRPVEASGGQLALRLDDGIFKRVCREAQANPSKHYLVLIDEINRANVAKVFGELITLLEKDKRGLLISLPQSKEPFTIPSNVYVLGTMNTADRSIKLLDSALRRRFAFLEMMPDSSLLRGAKIGGLALDDFLDELNRRIAAKDGREKQIGHSFLLDEDGPVSEPDEFARRFRQEILPLLQEYCYDDYSVLADYIGEKLVDREGQTLDDERMNDPERLVEALEEEFADDKGVAS